MTDMQQVMPTLRITNYQTSKAFYVDGLGFQIDWEHRFRPDFPVFMESRGKGGLFFYPSTPVIVRWAASSTFMFPTLMLGIANFSKREFPSKNCPTRTYRDCAR